MRTQEAAQDGSSSTHTCTHTLTVTRMQDSSSCICTHAQDTSCCVDVLPRHTPAENGLDVCAHAGCLAWPRSIRKRRMPCPAPHAHRMDHRSMCMCMCMQNIVAREHAGYVDVHPRHAPSTQTPGCLTLCSMCVETSTHACKKDASCCVDVHP
jgi:hypothetical protein